MFNRTTPLARPLNGLALAGLILLAPRAGAAAVHLVSDLGDTGAPGQFRTLVAAAADGDTVLIPAGTIVLASGQIDIAASLAIVGAGRQLTTIDGGGTSRVFEVQAGHVVTLSGVTVRRGAVAVGTGGGINNFGTLALVDVVVEDSDAEAGGGICNRTGAAMTLQTVTVRRNTTHGLTPIGGGIFNSGTMDVLESVVHDNTATGTSSSANGGGIGNSAVLRVANTTVSGNEAAANTGGGLFHAASATELVLINVTIANNRADSDGTGGGFGGGLGIMGANAAAANTIVARNRTGAGGTAPDCSGTLTSLGHNLIGDGSGCTIVGAAGGDIVGRNPWLAPLFDYGGPTPTHALLPWSPAIDAGSDAFCRVVDQRGSTRPADGNRDGVLVCDIGAYEAPRRW